MSEFSQFKSTPSSSPIDVKDAVARQQLENKADSVDVEGTKTTSGNPLTLTDCAPINAESLVVELEPKQDLHGQSAPYVGGAGKNKAVLKLSDIKDNNTTGTWSGNVYTINNGTITVLTDSDGNVTGIKVNGTFNATTIVRVSSDIPLIQGTAYKLNGCTSDTNNCRLDLTGNTSGSESYVNIDGDTSFTAGQSSFRMSIIVNSGYQASNIMLYPMLRLSTESDSTFAPWENICPITGYTECEVDDVGKNRLPMTLSRLKSLNTGGTWTNNTYNRYGVDVTVQTDSNDRVIGITYKGTSTSAFSFVLANKDDISTLFDESITLTGSPKGTTTSNGYCMIYKYNGSNNANDVGDGVTVTITENNSVLVQIYVSAANIVFDNKLFKPMIRFANVTDATYEPYQSSNATIQFGQTVYGGVSDFVNGGTSDNRNEVVFDGSSDETWYLYTASGVNQFHCPQISDIKPYVAGYVATMCDRFRSISIDNRANNYYTCYYGDGFIAFNVPDIADVSAWKTWLASNNVQVVYEKATPTQLSTPPTPLKLLQGTNNLSADGVMQIGYQPDNVVGEVKGEIEQHLEMPYLRILDNNVDTQINNYRIYYHFISSAYTLVNMAEMLQHRFILVEVIQNPSGTANHDLLHSALIDPRTIDGFTYSMKAGGSDYIDIESNLSGNKFNLSLRTTSSSYNDGDPTDYYVTIRMVD